MKKFSFLLVFLIIFFCGFSFSSCSLKKYSQTKISFYITNQLGAPVPNVNIFIRKLNVELFTKQNGKTDSSTIYLPREKDEQWFGAIVTIKADGYVPIIIFNFILEADKPRDAQFMLLFDDGTLPYCTYVEVPENNEIKRILLE